MQSIAELWRSTDSEAWEQAVERYWEFVQPRNLDLERAMDALDIERIRGFDAQQWYNFLRDEYFRWKYTAPNRYATTTRRLAEYATLPGGLDELHRIKQRLLELDPNDVAGGLLVACDIKGLGTAGASGLLALMYPRAFGTVDQFAVKALRNVPGLPEEADLARMKPESLSVRDGLILIGIMRRKALEMRRLFHSDDWTPRKVDKVLWTYGR